MKNRNEMSFILKTEWFKKIQSGEKNVEYRANTEYWRNRLLNKNLKFANFRLGYTPQVMRFEVQSVEVTSDKNDLNMPEVIAVRLGKKIS